MKFQETKTHNVYEVFDQEKSLGFVEREYNGCWNAYTKDPRGMRIYGEKYKSRKSAVKDLKEAIINQ